MKKILFLISIALIFTACGGGGSSTGGETPSTGESASKDVTLTPGVLYTVYAGNKLVRNVTKTVVQITHSDKASTSTVMLLEGNATIIRKP
jgi:hypothetical protein